MGMPGIFFLSGDTPLDVDNEESATINLSKMNELKPKLPWHLSFSYGKALQKTCIVTWLASRRTRPRRNRHSGIELKQTQTRYLANTNQVLAPVSEPMGTS